MLYLLENAKVVVTDSGGLQKESYFFQKPCITLRDETEWIELVENGVNRLVGSDKEKIIKTYKEFSAKNLKIENKNLYGNGKAGEKIINYLVKGLH
jgi:UDP-GlcNAc3NAcA epimerase